MLGTWRWRPLSGRYAPPQCQNHTGPALQPVCLFPSSCSCPVGSLLYAWLRCIRHHFRTIYGFPAFPSLLFWDIFSHFRDMVGIPGKHWNPWKSLCGNTMRRCLGRNPRLPVAQPAQIFAAQTFLSAPRSQRNSTSNFVLKENAGRPSAIHNKTGLNHSATGLRRQGGRSNNPSIHTSTNPFLMPHHTSLRGNSGAGSPMAWPADKPPHVAALSALGSPLKPSCA